MMEAIESLKKRQNAQKLKEKYKQKLEQAIKLTET